MTRSACARVENQGAWKNVEAGRVTGPFRLQHRSQPRSCSICRGHSGEPRGHGDVEARTHQTLGRDLTSVKSGHTRHDPPYAGCSPVTAVRSWGRGACGLTVVRSWQRRPSPMLFWLAHKVTTAELRQVNVPLETPSTPQRRRRSARDPRRRRAADAARAHQFADDPSSSIPPTNEARRDRRNGRIHLARGIHACVRRDGASRFLGARVCCGRVPAESIAR